MVHNRDEMPGRFHYSKPIHRLGEITVLPVEEGIIFSEVTMKVFRTKHYF